MYEDVDHLSNGPASEPADPVVSLYKLHVDRTLLRENLKLTHQERLSKLIAFLRLSEELRAAGRRAE